MFEDIPIGSNYTLEEVGTPERYIVPVPVCIKIVWNEVTKQTVENRLVRGGFRGIKVDETEKPLPEREIRIVKRREQTLSIAAKELERLILKQQGENR